MKRTIPPFISSQSTSWRCASHLRKNLTGYRWTLQLRLQLEGATESGRAAGVQDGTRLTEVAANDGGGGLGWRRPSMMDRACLGRRKAPRRWSRVRTPGATTADTGAYVQMIRR